MSKSLLSMQVSPSSIKLSLLFLVIVLCWSLSWSVGKYTLFYVPAFYLITLRLLIATVCFFIIAIILHKLSLPDSKDLPMIFSIGIFQFFLFTFLSLWGLKYMDAGHSAMLSYTTPIWVSLLSYFILKKPLSKMKVCSVILGVIGIVLLLNPSRINWNNTHVLLGNLLLLLAAFSWALAILSARYMKWHKTPSELVPWQFLLATLISIPVCCSTHSIVHVDWSVTLVVAILFLSIVATAFGYWGMVIISKEFPAITTSLGLLGVPFFSLLISHYFLHEVITIQKTFAMIFILIALGFTVYDDQKRIPT